VLYLLNPRVIAALVVVAALIASHTMAYRKGASNVRTEWAAAVSQANVEARNLERIRQRRADESAALAAAREARNRADADRVAGSVRGLRHDLDAARHYAAQSRAAADKAVATLGELFQQCSEAVGAMASEADRAYNEALELRQAWPR
jgi:hypothetical protein